MIVLTYAANTFGFQSEREVNKVQGELFKAQQELASKDGSGATRRRTLDEAETPSPEKNGAGGLSWANSKGKAVSDEMIERLQKRIAELEVSGSSIVMN